MALPHLHPIEVLTPESIEKIERLIKIAENRSPLLNEDYETIADVKKLIIEVKE